MSAPTWTGRVVMIALGAVLVLNGAWILRHCDQLRPLGQGDVAPSVPVPRADGQGELSLAALRGQVVLVDFWATWCKPCEATVPMQKRLLERYGARGFTILSVNEDQGDGAAARALAFAKAKGLDVPIAHDEHGHLQLLYKVEAYPHMVLVDREGRVRVVHTGFTSAASLEASLSEAIERAL